MENFIQDKVQQLGDLDLAILTSLMSGQHCIFSTDSGSNQDLQDELLLTCSETFGLRPTVIDCRRKTTVDEFNESILVDSHATFEDAHQHHDGSRSPPLSVNVLTLQGYHTSRFGSATNTLDDRRIADVVIARGLDLASSSVQVQTLELLRTKRIFTRTAMHVAPKDFLFVVILSKPGERLSHHLNDMFALSHFHAKEDSLPHLEDGTIEKTAATTFTHDDIAQLRSLTESVKMAADVRQYLHDIAIFMRLSRYVKGGVTAAATRHLRALSSALAPLHRLDYIPPALVALATRKVYPHRLVLATPETERSLQWGSDPEAIRTMLDGLTIDDVIEDVLASVDTPL
ncbi:hypothetical protein M433DRAFT_63337 [Acidomyces richmondensis BFW]|nr:MAG: hypothetical protein FE78DRAFT_77459 [Acidomyces sp. 'richmondensis']KYG47318.1 hypothetical protein M433DRAFT_63337 [Acidomyces richmondensis BFW]